jgi:Na+-translocating ferredoxin:NAD+ oxidoreductase RnfC subunit
MSLLDKIQAAGGVGAGGAGFPTTLKLNAQVEYLLVNAAECEPLLQTDKYVMRNFAPQIVEAVEETAKQVGAKQVFIAVKGVNRKEIDALTAAIAERQSIVKIFELDNYYPAGDELMLVYDITGRTVPPGAIPLKVGCVVSNVGTMLHIYDALRDKPVTHRYLTVTGKVNKPVVLRAPLGISFAECIEAAGGASIADYKVINGGPMMGVVSKGTDTGKNFVTKTTSGIIVLPGSGNFVATTDDLAVRHILNRAKAACIQCSFCSDLCPRRLIGHQLRPHLVMRRMAMQDFDKPLPPSEQVKEAFLCCGCGICETFACPMGLSPRQVNKYVKRELKGQKFEQTEPLTPDKLREYRKIAPQKIMARMGLGDLYNSKADSFIDLGTKVVHIPVSQHIGAPAEPCVAQGETVSCGQRIAKAVEGGPPSANIHASIDGRVVSVGALIEIEGD